MDFEEIPENGQLNKPNTSFTNNNSALFIRAQDLRNIETKKLLIN